MGKRRKARETVLEALYCYEIRDDDRIDEIFEYCREIHQLDDKVAEFAKSLLKKTIENLDKLDNEIAAHVKNWDLNRLSTIDKNILRLGLTELFYFPDIPRKVSIDEAIELAKTYGTAESGRFVNGVLDALNKDM
ncbi:transcription antitermination factor NusB [bacterium]|nr:transcription antitermination factor NusB [bacterium]